VTIRLKWNVIGPVALIIAAIAAVGWLDASTGGEAQPQAFLGAIGTPVRGTFVAPTATPFGAQPTPKPRPTFPVGANVPKGTKDDRDAQRRTDLLVLLDAANRIKARDGAYPSTNRNVQTVCKYKENDIGCKLQDMLPGGIPQDPLGNDSGYWYQSDGNAVKLYASLEGAIPDPQKCPTSDAELVKHENVICIAAP
jgi:hypothetical protein